MIKIQLDPIRFLGPKDETNFFSWLESILSFTRFEGEGKKMYAFFDADALTPYAFLELIRLFTRYKIDRKRLISVLNIFPEEIKQKYLNEGTEWH